MDVQGFSVLGERCFSAPVPGFLYDRLLDYLSGAEHAERLRLLDSDFELTPAELRFLNGRMEADLRARLQEAAAPERQAVRGEPLIRTTVLGEHVRLDPRFAPGSEVLALHRALEPLRRAETSGASVVVYVVPSLPSIPYRLAHVLKQAPDGLSRDELPDAIAREYDRLLGSPIVSPELRHELAAARGLVGGTTALEAVEVLRRWNLLHDDESRGAVVPTEKLRRIKL